MKHFFLPVILSMAVLVVDGSSHSVSTGSCANEPCDNSRISTIDILNDGNINMLQVKGTKVGEHDTKDTTTTETMPETTPADRYPGCNEDCTPTTELCNSKQWREEHTCSCKCGFFKPNLVFMMMDDMGFNDFIDSTDLAGAWPESNKVRNGAAPYGGNSVYVTTTYSESLCAPSRSAFMSGRFLRFLSSREGEFYWSVGASANETSLAQKLGAAGYMNYAIGKWHVGHTSGKHVPTGRGFHRYFGNYENGDHFRHCRFEKVDESNDRVEWKLPYFDLHYEEAARFDSHEDADPSFDHPWHTFPNEFIGHYKQDIYDVKVRHFILNHTSMFPEKPFFLYYAPYTFHVPMEAPQAYHDRCEAMGFSNQNAERFAQCAMTLAVDDSIGRLVGFLATLQRPSVFVVTSDNGGSAQFGYASASNIANGQPLRGNKGEAFEGGVRNHALLWSNHQELASTKSTWGGSHRFMHLVDWHATLAALGHATALDKPYSQSITMGHNMWEILRKDLPSSREWMYNSWRGESFRMGKYKLYAKPTVGLHENGKIHGHWWPMRDKPSHEYLEEHRSAFVSKPQPCFMLFDLEADPWEQTDLLDGWNAIAYEEAACPDVSDFDGNATAHLPVQHNLDPHALQTVRMAEAKWVEILKDGFYQDSNEMIGGSNKQKKNFQQQVSERMAQGSHTWADTSGAHVGGNECSNEKHTDYHTRIGVGAPGASGARSWRARYPMDWSIDDVRTDI